MYNSHTPTAPNGRHGRVAAPLHRAVSADFVQAESKFRSNDLFGHAFDSENRCTLFGMRSERPILTPPLFTREELRRLVAEMID